jgi:hypothetical protein
MEHTMTEEEILKRAFAMPLTNPAFPPGPYRFVNREYLIITYRTDPERLRAIVPEPLALDAPLVKYEFIRMPEVKRRAETHAKRRCTRARSRPSATATKIAPMLPHGFQHMLVFPPTSGEDKTASVYADLALAPVLPGTSGDISGSKSSPTTNDSGQVRKGRSNFGIFGPRASSHPSRRNVAVDLALVPNEDDAVLGGVPFVPFHLGVRDGNACPVGDYPLSICDDGNVVVAFAVEVIRLERIGLAAATHVRVVRLHEALEPLADIGGRVAPLAIVSGPCLGSEDGEECRHNYIASVAHYNLLPLREGWRTRLQNSCVAKI